ncbi:MAG TPA: lac repressor, partial [Pantoea sp.]|nr:lac repressor [Pantoea sp.]
IQTLCGNKPVIFMDVEPQAQVAQCQYSNAHGARAAVEHLVALGHRQIGLLNGPAQAISAQLREAAWREALAAHRLTPFCALRGDWSAQSGYQAMLQQLPDCLPQALLVANDQMALGAMRALHQHGVAIPGEISVVGYDDTAESAWYQPPLTTVRQDLQALGEQCVETLLARLQDAPPPSRALEPALVLRATTAAPGGEVPNGEALAQQLQRIARQLLQR